MTVLASSSSIDHVGKLNLPGQNNSVSLVICTCHRPQVLRMCLEAVKKLVPAPDEVLVIDNTDGDAETEHVVLRSGGVRYFVEAAPGLSRARNRGMQESKCAIVAFLDDDARPSTDWLQHLLTPFVDERVAVVTGETIALETEAGFSRQQPQRSLSSEIPLWFEMANFGGLGFGTNMALRRQCDLSTPLFDVRLGRGAPIRIAEESHAFTRLLLRGYWAIHVPAAIVIHPHKQRDVEQEATASFAYWLLLFCEFSGHRCELIGFLCRRLRHRPLSWPRNPHGPGEIISSGTMLKVKSGFSGLRLYLRTRKLRAKH